MSKQSYGGKENMFKFIEKYLKEQFDRIVFIELKKDADLKGKFEYIKGIPIPILVKELVKSSDSLESNNISLTSMVKGMIYSIGIDSDLKYREIYTKFIYDFDEHIEDYIGYSGVKLAEEKELIDAIIFFKALITINEDNVNGLYNYGKCCQDIARDMEDKDKIMAYERESLECFEILIEKFPDFAPAYYYIGFHYANQKLFKKASLVWSKCLELDIDDEKKGEVLVQIDKIKNQVQYEEGYTYVLNNQPEKGLEKLKPLLDKYSDWWNLLFFIGLAYRQQQNYKDAIDHFEKILTIKPTQVDTYNELGLCYSSLNNYSEAEKYFKKALKFNGEDSEILSNLGILYMENGDIKKAKETFERSIEINPDDEITKMCIQKLNVVEDTN